jgi:hemerythrin superfamily protein
MMLGTKLAQWRTLDEEIPMNKTDVPSNQKDALSMLLDDHRMVKKMFKDFEKEKDGGAKQTLVAECCAALKLHTEIEETLFYPFLRDQSPEDFGELLDEAVVEHASAKELIAQLEAGGDTDALHDAKFKVLGEYVGHHIEEEEGELFPKVIKKKIDLSDLYAQMEQKRSELEPQLAPK